MNINQAFAAGASANYGGVGDFFRLMSCPFPVELRFYRNGNEVSRAEAVTEGFAERFKGGGFDAVKIINGASAQTVVAVSRAGNEVNFDRPPTGAVTIANANGAFVQGPAPVGTVDTGLLAANALRRYLLVQNNDPANAIYINLTGNAATVANGIRIAPLGALELASFVPTGAIRAIAGVAVSAVVVVEG